MGSRIINNSGITLRQYTEFQLVLDKNRYSVYYLCKGVKTMQKFLFVFEEFFRSFRKNLFKNILLALMFSISFVMTVLMSSYYLDLGELDEDLPKYQKDGIWYGVGTSNEVIGDTESYNTVKGCRNLMNYYEALHDSEKHPLISIHTGQNVFAREDDIKRLFGDVSYKGFLGKDHPQAFMADFGESSCSVLEMKTIMLEDHAYELFDLKTEQGEGLSKENLTIENSSDSIPIVLGNEYKGLISVGDELDVNIYDYVYSCRVAGILEKGSMVPENGSEIHDMILLDSYILFPYMVRVSNDPDNPSELARYAFLDALAIDFNTSKVFTGSNSKIREVVSSFRNISEEFGMPQVEIYAASMGLRLMNKESENRVRIMLILTIILLCFTFYGLFVALYDRLQSNKRTYGIYLVNGCPISAIIMSYLLEIAVIMLPAVLICRYVFSEENIEFINRNVILSAVYGFAELAFLIGTIFIIFIMHGVDTEHLIRRKE